MASLTLADHNWVHCRFPLEMAEDAAIPQQLAAVSGSGFHARWRIPPPREANDQRRRLPGLGACCGRSSCARISTNVSCAVWALLGAAVLVLAAFVLYERRLLVRGGDPVFDPTLMRSRSFSAGLIASVLFFSGIGSLFLMLSVYLQDGAGRTALETGLTILPYAIGSLITSGIGVAFAARAGRVLLVAGSLVVALSYIALWAVVNSGEDPGYWPLAGGLFLGGLCLGLVVPILVNVILAGVPAQHAGAAGGVLSTVNQIGGAVGIATLTTAFFAAVSSDSGRGLDVYGPALGGVLLVSAALYVVAGLAMCLLPKTAPQHG